MADYPALTAYLRERAEPTVELSFADVDTIVGGLPVSARRHSAWWANSRTAQPHAYAWLDAGRRAQPDFTGGRVRFPRGAETTPRQRGNVEPASLEPTGEMLTATVTARWLVAGPIRIDGGRLRFPSAPTAAGIYRMTITAAGGTVTMYVGEADNLSRRFTGYRNPGASQPTNQRLHALLLSAIGDGGCADLALITDAAVDGRPLDLRTAVARRLVENAALVELATRGVTTANL